MKFKFLLVLFGLLFVKGSLWAQQQSLELVVDPGKNWIGEGKVGPVSIQVEPSFACWLTSEDGRYIETIYVTEKVATGEWNGSIGRENALPVWGFSRGKKNEYNMYLPSKTQPMADSVTTATPVEFFTFPWIIPESQEPGTYKVYFEINISFDFNEIWTKGRQNARNPHRNKVNGQPSLVYVAELDVDETIYVSDFRLIGCGSSTGEDGAIYALEGVDSALCLLNALSLQLIDMDN